MPVVQVMQTVQRVLRKRDGVALRENYKAAVQVCAAAPTCGGRLLSGLRRTVVPKDGISRCLESGCLESQKMAGRQRLHSRQQGAGYEGCLVADAVLNGPASPVCKVKKLNRREERYSWESGCPALFR